MTMPDERSRAVVWAGGLLIELAQDKSLPLALRRRAVIIARHFPTVEQVESMAIMNPSCGLEPPSNDPSWAEQCKFGPLRYDTRLEWPDDELKLKKEGVDQVLARVATIAGSHDHARRWLSEPLPTFRGKTPLELVDAGRTQDLLAYLDTVEAGFVG